MRDNPYTDRYNALTRRILAHCSAERPGENLFVSPLSVLSMLAIAAYSTGGTTRDEILRLLNGPDGRDVALASLGGFQKEFSEGGAFTSANAVCIRSDCAASVNRAYEDRLLSGLNGELFSGDDMIAEVNRWAERKTGGMIRNAMPESMKKTMFSLLNAVAFKSAWDHPFKDEDVKDRYFLNADGSRSRVMMLHGTEHYYIECKDFTGFVKPYEDDRFSFMALLPRKNRPLAEAAERVDFPALFRSAYFDNIHVRLPEFRFGSEQSLDAFCQAEGISEIYSEHADFSPLSDKWLRLDTMLHKTWIEVDRNGTRAAAFSLGAVMDGCLPPMEFREVFLDRPFLFAIVHNDTGIPLFTGMVNRLENAVVRPRRLVERLRKRN